MEKRNDLDYANAQPNENQLKKDVDKIQACYDKVKKARNIALLPYVNDPRNIQIEEK